MRIPCKVAIAPAAQNNKIGIVRGDLSVIFFWNRRAAQTRRTSTTTKSSARMIAFDSAALGREIVAQVA